MRELLNNPWVLAAYLIAYLTVGLYVLYLFGEDIASTFGQSTELLMQVGIFAALVTSPILPFLMQPPHRRKIWIYCGILFICAFLYVSFRNELANRADYSVYTIDIVAAILCIVYLKMASRFAFPPYNGPKWKFPIKLRILRFLCLILAGGYLLSRPYLAMELNWDIGRSDTSALIAFFVFALTLFRWMHSFYPEEYLDYLEDCRLLGNNSSR